ncbi:hypothetical protein N7478_008485 [Penicillium angulare]|uniref:uncharacterized protein n=1 Tax=Penicillium angulare TaxID=116970 RepID=UPI0025422645|nr:uncharacterized protein N7478_008485 [Penicillium angulare]KAJ5273360.1 hypothetical protein N7478_008485 [Penicillium angulare]
MAYNAVQTDEVASDSGSDLSSPSPPAFQPLGDADNLGSSHLKLAKTSDSPGTQLGAIYRSMTSSKYEVVEADDYHADPSDDPRRMPPLNTAVARHSSSESPLRSACSDAPIPLSHPTPDLQSFQGAYTGNVERLEQSAERLSSSTQDIGSEIRKMDQQQKRQSCSSASNSIIMRNGAFSPGNSLARSPHGSTRSTRQRSVSSGSCLAQVAEPEHDNDHYLDRAPATLPIAPAPQLPIFTPSSGRFYISHDDHPSASATVGPGEDIERPDTAASGDTFQQARTLFTDFDGVHFAPLERADSSRKLSLTQPPLARNADVYKTPQPTEHMVYYPAPVPRMLNLPPKLSRRAPIAEREKRRTQILTSIEAENRKAEFGEQEPGSSRKDKRQSALPPQLRASVFFDPPSTTLELEVKQDSAVATLDSVLDASAHAPVSAFTDHPYAGHVGSYVYGNKRKNIPRQKPERDSHSQMDQYKSTHSDRESASGDSEYSGHGAHEEESERFYRNQHGHGDSEGSETESEGQSSEEEEEDEAANYVGPPNTLLAELELRKQELQQRRRTALPKATEGMQATLLELDAMAQEQSDKRRRRPVTLAWDNRHAADDDDVPLAMLYPDQNKGEDGRPQGLMERHQTEENEPLSSRRARLRGEPIPEKRPVTVYVTEPPAPKEQPSAEEDTVEEIETLAERSRRLKGQNPSDTAFSHDLMAEFDNRLGITPKENNPAPQPSQSSRPPAQEETLAQRRARLQKEKGIPNGVPKLPRTRQSMAALPQVRPNLASRSKSSYGLPQNQHPGMQMQHHGNRMSMQQFPAPMKYPTHMGYPANLSQPPPPYTYGQNQPPPYAYNNTMMTMHNMGYPMPNACGPTMTRQPVEPGQRDVIDRWRESIR